MVKRYEPFSTRYDDGKPTGKASVRECPSGSLVKYKDALPYMVWQPIPADLSELPRAELMFTKKGDPEEYVETCDNRHGDATRSAIHGNFTHWALAPVFKEEENA